MSDWGQGVINNTIEWGRGSTNNTIDWGSVYGESYAGDTALEVAGLLDQYGGASAAYSVRKLSSTATNALRVRRSSDNAEQDIGFVGNDLDTASLTSFVGVGNNGFVATWYDQSGNGNNITQSSASAQRQIVSAGSLIVSNTKAAAQNTGTSTQYDSTGRLYNLTATNLWMFSVQEIVDGGVTGYILGSAGASDRGFLILSSGSTEILQIATIRSGGTSSSTFGSAGNLLGQKVLSVSANRTNRSGWINGVSQGSNTDNNSDFSTFTNNTVWGSLASTARSVVGFAQELILFEADQTGNRTAIESNINAYYSIYWDGSQTGLLDAYPSASAAYSVRALNSAYTGALIRVRRSSDNAEQDIRADYNGNLRTDDLLSFVGANNGFVVTWYDQSGNGLNMNQTTAANQAQIVNSGVVNTLGSKPSLVFSAFSTPYTTTANFNHSAQLTAFASWQTNAPNQGVFQIGSVNTLGSMFYIGAGSSYAARTLAGTEARFADTVGSHVIQSGYYNNGRQEVYIDNVIGGTIGTGALASATNAVVSLASLTGSIYALVGNLQELIMYSSDQRANLSAINTNMINNLK